MHDDNLHLRNVLRPMAAEPPAAADDDTGLPSLNEKQNVSHARPANKPIYSIHFINTAGDVHTFQYVHLDSHSTYTAECITLKFLGMEPVRAIIRGRNLWRLYDLIHLHRMPWVMQAARDFAQDGQTIVTDISFTAISADEG